MKATTLNEQPNLSIRFGTKGGNDKAPFKPVIKLRMYDDIKGISNKCTATAITPNAILTAAHCATDEWNVSIIDPSSIGDPDGLTTIAMKCTTHPEYIGGAKNYDLSLLESRVSNDIAVCVPLSSSKWRTKIFDDLGTLGTWNKKSPLGKGYIGGFGITDGRKNVPNNQKEGEFYHGRNNYSHFRDYDPKKDIDTVLTVASLDPANMGADPNILAGDSGSAVFSEHMRIIGVASSSSPLFSWACALNEEKHSFINGVLSSERMEPIGGYFGNGVYYQHWVFGVFIVVTILVLLFIYIWKRRRRQRIHPVHVLPLHSHPEEKSKPSKKR